MSVGPISQLALSQYTASLSMVKQRAEADQAVVGLIQEAVEMAKVTASRGNNVNMVV